MFDRWIGIPFWGSNGGVEAGALDIGLLILILPNGRSLTFPAFFEGVGLAVAFCLPARVLKGPTDGSLEDSLPGGWVKTRTARINMSPSKPGMGR
jgi:hypothetical protein